MWLELQIRPERDLISHDWRIIEHQNIITNEMCCNKSRKTFKMYNFFFPIQFSKSSMSHTSIIIAESFFYRTAKKSFDLQNLLSMATIFFFQNTKFRCQTQSINTQLMMSDVVLRSNCSMFLIFSLSNQFSRNIIIWICSSLLRWSVKI